MTCGHKIRTKVNSSPEWVGFSCMQKNVPLLKKKELVLASAAELELLSLSLAVCYKCTVMSGATLSHTL